MKLFDLDLEIGEPQVLGGLFVFPLRSTAADTDIEYVPGPEALARGVARVGELDPPQVPWLEVHNEGNAPVLLIEGECLLGGDQNRTLNVSVLCAGRASTVVPVACVEAGRWGNRKVVTSSPRNTPGDLRRRKTISMIEGYGGVRSENQLPSRHGDQRQVWDDVEDYAARYVVASATRSLADVQARIEPTINELLGRLRVAPTQTGAVYASCGRVLGADFFDRPATCGRYLPAIVGGYLFDAPDRESEKVTLDEVERFLTDLAGSEHYESDAVGLGTEVRIQGGDVVAIGVGIDNQLVHLAAFAN
jgi:ARG and Rhodanese-Phosphatase-superfamily-associated Protein domain